MIDPIFIIVPGLVVIFVIAVFGEKIFMWANQAIWKEEKPERVNGLQVRLGGFDNLGLNPPAKLLGRISFISNNQYRVDFDQPFVRENLIENFVIITARHSGYPISRMNRRGLGVNGVLESGHGLIGIVAKA